MISHSLASPQSGDPLTKPYLQNAGPPEYLIVPPHRAPCRKSHLCRYLRC